MLRIASIDPDTEFDNAITAVSDKMKGDRTRNRVATHFLLAENVGKLSALN